MSRESWYQKRLEAMKAEARERAWAAEQGIPTESSTARVSPLDIDFLLMLGFALLNDISDIVLEIFGITKPGGMALDIFTFAIIGFWIYKKTGQIAKSKRQKMEAMQKKIGQRTAQMEKQLAKAAKSPIRRVLLRMGIAFLGEFIWWLGLLPFWTITVVMTLREKGE